MGKPKIEGEPANAARARAKMMDEDVRALCAAGLNNAVIAAQLEIHRYQVREAKGRMGLNGRNGPAADDIEDNRPKRRYACPVCRAEHWSAPYVTTCAPCKLKQAGAGSAFLP